MKWTPGRLGLGLITAALVALVALTVGLLNLRTPAPLGEAVDLTRPGPALRTVTVYYIAADSLDLVAEDRAITAAGSGQAMAAELIDLLTRSSDSVRSTLPPGTRLLHYFERPDGEAVLDLSAVVETIPSTSVLEDRMRLAAFARTLADNLAPVRRVRLLVQGRPLTRWGGHLRLEPVLDLEGWL